ncbi:uncharacterized protein LOC143284155 [Babylonia areolata]|uniref:uncharacterized protein LOC143284155 n=1 Tax=Babylonia areolata TaxID=304850 RepID=UPI003FCF88CE
MYYSLYVGHLPRNTTREDLIDLFAAHGAKEAVILKKSQSYSYSYGFVRFESPQSVIDALKEGEWTLHGEQVTVNVCMETRAALRQVITSKHPTSKAVERDNSIRSTVKETCRLINKDLDIINGEVLLDARWVLGQMENCPARYTPKLSGSPDPLALMTRKDLWLYLEQGPFSVDEPETGQKRKQEVTARVKDLLSGIQSRLEESVSEEDFEFFKLFPNERIERPDGREGELSRKVYYPQNMISVMEDMGMESPIKQHPRKEQTEQGDCSDSTSDVNKTPVKNKDGSRMFAAKKPQKTDLEKKQQLQNSASTRFAQLLQLSEQARTGKEPVAESDVHHHSSTHDRYSLKISLSGPGGPCSREPSSQPPHVLRKPRLETEQPVPGGPPSAPCSVRMCSPQQSMQRYGFSRTSTKSSVLRHTLFCEPSPGCENLSAGNPESLDCYRPSQRRTKPSAAQAGGGSHVTQLLPASSTDCQKPTTTTTTSCGAEDPPGVKDIISNNIPHKTSSHCQSLCSPSAKQPFSPLQNSPKHVTAGRGCKTKLLLNLLGQKDGISGTSFSSGHSVTNGSSFSSREREDGNSAGCQNGGGSSSCGQFKGCQQEDWKPSYSVPERCKAAFENEDAAALENSDTLWEEFGKANHHFLGKGSVEEDGPVKVGSQGISRCSTQWENSSHVAQSPRSKVENTHAVSAPQRAELESPCSVHSTTTLCPDSPHLTEQSWSSTSHTLPDVGTRTPESKFSSSGACSPSLPPSLCGVGRGRGKVQSALRGGLWKFAGSKREDQTAPDQGASSQLTASTPVSGGGRDSATM